VSDRDNPGDFKPGNPHAFKKGQSGNPGGRAKGIERIVRELVAEQKAKSESDPNVDLDGWQRLTLHLFQMALGETKATNRDQVAAAKLLYERAYGHPKQKVDVTGDATSQARDLSPLSTEQLELLAALDVPVGDDDGTPTAH